MNPTQQRTHTRKTEMLANAIAGTQAAVLERFEDVEARAQQLSDRIGDERTARREADAAVIREAYAGDNLVILQLDAFRDRGFWSRLNWLLTGR